MHKLGWVYFMCPYWRLLPRTCVIPSLTGCCVMRRKGQWWEALKEPNISRKHWIWSSTSSSSNSTAQWNVYWFRTGQQQPRGNQQTKKDHPRKLRMWFATRWLLFSFLVRAFVNSIAFGWVNTTIGHIEWQEMKRGWKKGMGNKWSFVWSMRNPYNISLWPPLPPFHAYPSWRRWQWWVVLGDIS